MLCQFLNTHHEKILTRSKEKAVSRRAPRATDEEIIRGIPIFFLQLVEQLCDGGASDNVALNLAATAYGKNSLADGFTIGEVVHAYGDICQAVTEVATEQDAPITSDEFRTLNLCLDNAIASAVSSYANQERLDASSKEQERFGFFAHEIRNALTSAVIAFAQIKDGKVGANGNTSIVLGRSLARITALINKTLTAIRLNHDSVNSERFELVDLFEEARLVSSAVAQSRNLVMNVDLASARGVTILADRDLVLSAITNILQNAVKFTHEGGTVTLQTERARGRVVITISDECGGLKVKPEALFAPFTQANENRCGLGLGLGISRKAIKANGGDVNVTDVPGRGCVFVIELPDRIA